MMRFSFLSTEGLKDMRVGGGSSSSSRRSGDGSSILASAIKPPDKAPSLVIGALLLACVSGIVVDTQAQDIERERRLEAEIVDMIFDGEPLHLQGSDGHRFLAIHSEATLEPVRGAVIVMHGRGFHPDWEEVVSPLRTHLPTVGWETLSLQMPVLAKDAKYYDYVPILPAAFPRILAGIAFLRDRGIDNIVLAAHSCSVHMAMAFTRHHGDGSFDAFIGIGMGATDYRQPMREPFPLESMRVPVLDLFGSEEFPGVLRAAPERLAAIRTAGNPLSAQRTISDAGHFFEDREDALVDAVSEWLGSLPP